MKLNKILLLTLSFVLFSSLGAVQPQSGFQCFKSHLINDAVKILSKPVVQISYKAYVYVSGLNIPLQHFLPSIPQPVIISASVAALLALGSYTLYTLKRSRASWATYRASARDQRHPDTPEYR